MAPSLHARFLDAMRKVEERHNGSRAEAARWFGVSRQRWGQWILGVHTPNASVMERLIESAKQRPPARRRLTQPTKEKL